MRLDCSSSSHSNFTTPSILSNSSKSSLVFCKILLFSSSVVTSHSCSPCVIWASRIALFDLLPLTFWTCSYIPLPLYPAKPSAPEYLSVAVLQLNPEILPAAGLNARPATPFPKPFMLPRTPVSWAPLTGCITSPETPSQHPRPNSCSR